MSKNKIRFLGGLTLFTLALVLTGFLSTQLFKGDDVGGQQPEAELSQAAEQTVPSDQGQNAETHESEIQQKDQADSQSKAQQTLATARDVSETPLDRALKTWDKEFAVVRKTKGKSHFQRVSFYETKDLKYSKIRVDEIFKEDPQVNPEAKHLTRLVYVADHMLVRYEEEQRGLIDGLLAGFPELSIRHELETGNHLLIEFPLEDQNRDYFSYWSARLKAVGLNPEKDVIVYHTATPLDPDYVEQWALNNTGQTGGTEDADIDADLAWDIQKGSKNVVVAVVDTGVDLDHKDLSANLWVSGSARGFNIVSGGTFPDDINGHGTHVAGVIGARSNNGRNIAGLNWDVSIMPVKVLNDLGMGMKSDLVEGLDKAAAYGASIINLSLGGYEATNSVEDSLYLEVREARDMGDNGVLYVIAAGNDGINIDEYDPEVDDSDSPPWPALLDLSNVITVASTDHNDELSGFSNFGPVSVDLAAPGSEILSTVPNDMVDTYDGTSMAAPHVAGVAALIKAQDPSLSYLEIKNLILNTVDQLPGLKGLTLTGGRLNANNALLSFNGANAMITALNLKPTGGPANNNDGLLTLGETMLVDVAYANFGVAAASSASLDIELIQDDAYAVLLGSANLPLADIAAGETVVLEDAFEISADMMGTFDFSQEVELKFTLNFDGRSFVKYASFEMFQNASLSGKVFDGSDGTTPIAGALVEIIAETAAGVFEWSTLTAADGSYNFDLFTGIVSIRISAEGYLTMQPDVLDLNPVQPDLTNQNYELGVGGFSVLSPTIDVTMPANDQMTLAAKIQNTGTSPNDLVIAMDYSIVGETIVSDQIFGMEGTGTSKPVIMLLDEFTLEVEESVELTLPENNYAIDFCFYDGQMWILTRNSDSSASIFSYDMSDWSLTFTRKLDMSNSRAKSVESLIVASIPVPTDDDESATEDALALLAQHSYYRYPRMYRINPRSENIADLTVEVAPLGDEEEDSTSYWWYIFDRISGTNAKSRGTFFVGTDWDLGEFTIESANAIAEESVEFLYNFNYIDFFFNDDYYYYYYYFSYRDIKSITYFEANGGLYALTAASRGNLLKLNYDDQEILEIYDAPTGLDRLTSSSSSSIAWLRLGYRTGAIPRGQTATLPIGLDTTDMRNGESRAANLRVRSPSTGIEQQITINLNVGDLSQLPSFVQWYQKYYLQDPGAGALDSDTDGDGIPAQIEYVVGGNPTKNDNANGGRPTAVRDPNTGDIFIQFRRRTDLPDGTITIKGSDSLAKPMEELVEGVNYEVISVTPVNEEIEEVLISSPFNGASFYYQLDINF